MRIQWNKPYQSQAVGQTKSSESMVQRQKGNPSWKRFPQVGYLCLTPKQPNLEDEISLRGVGLWHLGFRPFFSFWFWSGFAFSWFDSLGTWKDPPWFLFLSGLPTSKPIPRPCHIHPEPSPIFFFLGLFLFSIKGITLFALGCEATPISIIPKIPK